MNLSSDEQAVLRPILHELEQDLPGIRFNLERVLKLLGPLPPPDDTSGIQALDSGTTLQACRDAAALALAFLRSHTATLCNVKPYVGGARSRPIAPPAVVDMWALVRECIRVCEAKSDVDDVPDFRAAFRGAGLVLGNEGELTRAMLNIIGNAVKYSFRRGPRRKFILVSGATWRVAGITIRVKNFGVGVLSGERESLRVAGRRGRLALANEIGGMGIGVAEVIKIAKGHNGDFALDSKPPPAFASEEEYLNLLKERPQQAIKVPWVTTAVFRIAGS